MIENTENKELENKVEDTAETKEDVVVEVTGFTLFSELKL